MRKSLILAIALALAVLAPTAIALGSTASYGNGQLTITSEPGTFLRVFAEQPNGSYDMAVQGRVDATGTFQFHTPALGPINGQPQFRISLTSPAGQEWLVIPDEEGGWGWD